MFMVLLTPKSSMEIISLSTLGKYNHLVNSIVKNILDFN